MREMKTEKEKEFNLLHKHIITESGIYVSLLALIWAEKKLFEVTCIIFFVS